MKRIIAPPPPPTNTTITTCATHCSRTPNTEGDASLRKRVHERATRGRTVTPLSRRRRRIDSRWWRCLSFRIVLKQVVCQVLDGIGRSAARTCLVNAREDNPHAGHVPLLRKLRESLQQNGNDRAVQVRSYWQRVERNVGRRRQRCHGCCFDLRWCAQRQ